MKKKRTANTSQTDWDRLDSMADAEIDTSDIPPLDDRFFHRAKGVVLRRHEEVTVQLDADLVDWFRSHADDWQARMNAALRLYMEVHRREGHESAA